MAGKGLGTLTLDLVARIGGFTGPLDKASRTADKRMREIEARAKKFGIAFGAAVVAAGTAAGYAIKQAIDQADQLNEISQKIGVPTDVLSGLNYAAKLAGVATEELQAGLVKLTKFQADAAQGSKENVRVFETLGIAVKDAGGNLRNTSDLFRDFADVFASLKDGPEKTALAVKVFGKAGAELIPLLNEGRSGLAAYAKELDDLGGTVTPEAARQADEFNDNLDKLKTAVGGLALQAARELLPALIEITEQVVAFTKDGRDAAIIAEDIGTAFKVAAQFIGDAARSYRVFRETYQKEGLFADDFFGSDSGFLAREQAAIDAAEAAAKRIQSMRDLGLGMSGGYAGGDPRGRGAGAGRKAGALDRNANNLRDLFTPEAKEGKKAGKSDAERAAEQLADAYARMNDQMREQIALFGQASEEARVRYDVEQGALANLGPAQKEVLLNQARMLDSLKADKELLDERNKAEETRLKLMQDARDSVAQTIEDLQFELDLMGKTNAQRIAEIELRRIGLGLSKEEAEAAKKRFEDLALQLEAGQKQIAALDEFRASFEDNLASVLDGSKSIADAFKSIADAFIAQVARMIAQNWTEQLFGQMGGLGTGSSGGGILSLFSSFLGGARAEGGPVMAGVPYLVGEKGPEIVVPKAAGTVVPNHAISPGGRTLQLTVNAPAGMDKQTREQFALDVARQVQRATARTA
jgi:hypothetical protein